MDSLHDIIVIGAGPGGSSAAYFLARQGFDVLLLDKALFPRDKTCGDGLPPRALPVLDEMGVLPDIRQIGCAMTALEIVAPGGHSLAAPIPPMPHAPAYTVVIPRLKLDDLLRQRAMTAGVVFQGGVHVATVELERDGICTRAERGGRSTEYRGRMAVIATGASPALLQRAGILRQPPAFVVAARAYFEDIPALDMRAQFRFDHIPLPGYGWLFPTSASSANIGAGFLPGPHQPPSPQVALRTFLDGTSLRQQLASARQVGPIKGFPLRHDFTASPTFAERVLLVGEAAGLVNPLTGDGIDYALESGRIAAEHLGALLADGDFSRPRLQAYDRALRQRYQGLFEFCEQVRRLSFNRHMLNAVIWLAVRRPELVSTFTDVVLGGRPVAGRLTLLQAARVIAMTALGVRS